MRYVVITLVAVTFLLIQSTLCKKKEVFYIFILPVISVAVGLIYQAVSLHTVQMTGFLPFLIAAGCLLLFGIIKRLDNRKKEMEHMKSQDL
ncbi:hypothetical protein LB941_01750 [Ligilactobacillus sp. WILCCON 0076]|uniref:Uncharacterized protein n=1 Tax=Ligilactobacillus ubinensis TaxID=2876789 RepID=A0A9X2FI97_9LACO|nr:hypothetical protein [Ligilactobacillus ubinensis]MCP0886059.1 hypothetical protein [Ligilactobacillus ubinensis]